MPVDLKQHSDLEADSALAGEAVSVDPVAETP